MTSTNFVADQTRIVAGWLNDADETVYRSRFGAVIWKEIEGERINTGAASTPDRTTFISATTQDILLHAFDGGGATESLTFKFHIPHSVKVLTSTDISPSFHIHWSDANATPSGVVEWTIEYTVARGYGNGSFITPATLTTTQTVGTQYQHLITDETQNETNLDVLPGGTFVDEWVPDGFVLGSISRISGNAADTSTTDAFFIALDIHAPMSREGTVARNDFTSEGFNT